MKENILLIGTGPMAQDYAKVLDAQGRFYQVIGRGLASSEKFEALLGVKPFVGGIDTYLANNDIGNDCSVIIATGTETLMHILKIVLAAGVSKVLIEKPAALSVKELLDNQSFLKTYLDKVFVAYNRRFYASVVETRKIIEEDGGLQSMHFEFTEWAHKIEPLTKAAGVKENWFFANSTHVVDLAFYLAGKPIEWNTYSKGGTLRWHAKTNFTGAGITEKGVLFSYLSNWESAGRWAIELYTEKRRVYLKPIEGISIQEKGSVALVEHKFDDELDIKFKPGLFNQVKAFFSNENDTQLCNLSEQIINAENIYTKILD
ncbi:Gfo/Idh/MocA family protein [Pedobacter sp.]|uniref:Gfo/Idh/MocA family protein n=1 Tax=Pedobacter sp. TaxID=1411316 RepID=UPI003BA93739